MAAVCLGEETEFYTKDFYHYADHFGDFPAVTVPMTFVEISG